MQSCIIDVKAWTTANMLKLNTNKTKLMLVTSKRTKHLNNLPTSITIGNAQILFKQSVKNLGFTSDCHLTMNAHVSNIARTCYFELRCLASIRRFPTSTATATLVSAFVLSRIDYVSERSSSTKLKLNESSKRNAWLSLRDTSPWRATNSEECDVVWRNRYLSFLVRLFTSETMVHHDGTR